jgi:hypothetical protein
VQSKKDFLCVIRDEMDHSKITLLLLQMKNKMVSKLRQLPITLIGMIGDEAFIQYSNELWLNDPNFMIRLLLCLFHSLEKKLVKESRVLFEFELQNVFFQQIL